jgi:hypothetical protein
MKKQPPRRRIDHDAWVSIARTIYDTPDNIAFACVACGHRQSRASVLERNKQLKADDVSCWVFMACEGRYTEGVGCDWTLGGLFKLHTLEVVHRGDVVPCFEFADASAISGPVAAAPDHPAS